MLSNKAILELLYSAESDAHKVKTLQQYLAPYKRDARNCKIRTYFPATKPGAK